MTADSQLHALLETMQGVGELSSRGEFTLDPARANLLLERYQLPSPAYFMLHAVGAAVLSGSSRVEIVLKRGFFSLTFDGQPFSPEDAAECVASLWTIGDTPEQLRLQELAIARGGALQWGAGEFAFSSLADGRQQLRVPRPGMLNRVVGKLWKSLDLDVVVDHLAPLPNCSITVNGKPLPDIVYPQAALRAFAVGKGAEDWLRRLPLGCPTSVLQVGEMNDGDGVIVELPSGQGSPLWSLGGYKSARRSFWPGFLDIVHNGRLYRCQMPAGWGNWWGIFYARCLRRDLSFSFLQESDLQRLQSYFALARSQ